MCTITVDFSSTLYIHMCILQYIKNSYSSLYSSSLLPQQWEDDSVDSVALMCQGVSITDSSHMYSLIVMYPQLPYSCSKVQMRETRQAIWEELWHKSSSNNRLAVWMPLRISVRVFSICRFLCLSFILSHLVQLSLLVHVQYACSVTEMLCTLWCSTTIPALHALHRSQCKLAPRRLWHTREMRSWHMDHV